MMACLLVAITAGLETASPVCSTSGPGNNSLCMSGNAEVMEPPAVDPIAAAERAKAGPPVARVDLARRALSFPATPKGEAAGAALVLSADLALAPTQLSVEVAEQAGSVHVGAIPGALLAETVGRSRITAGVTAVIPVGSATAPEVPVQTGTMPEVPAARAAAEVGAEDTKAVAEATHLLMAAAEALAERL